MFSGSIPALVTPFCDGAFSEKHFRALIDWQIDQGSSALVPAGTTGEASTLSNAEHHRVIEVCIEQAGLVVAPYYNRPNQEGIYAHFEAMTKKNDLPIVLYNVPARTVTDIKPETVARLAQLPTVIGIKDASGDMPRVTDHRLACGPDFCLLSGVDEQSLAFNAAGGRGCISVTANVAPKLCAEFQAACASGDYNLARQLNDKLYPLHLALFSDASPGPVKYALSRVIDGFPTELRLPMTPPSEASRRQVDAALENAGLI